MDSLVSVVSFIANCIDGERVCVKFSDGSIKQGTLSTDFQTMDWKGKCLDLEKAYRQVPVSESSLKFSVILVHDPHGQARYFVSQSLPFGACSSVYAFNRISASIRFLLQKRFRMVLTNFYDDFPLLEPLQSCELLDKIVSRFLKLLGWRFAEGDKNPPFGSSFNVLGSNLDLTAFQKRRVVLQNKAGRMERIAAIIKRASATFPPAKHDMQVIAGLLQYATGQALGATLKLAAKAFSSLCSSECSIQKKDFKELCDWVTALALSVKPRCLRFDVDKRPICIFTDASWENRQALWGMAFIDPASGSREVYGGEVPSTLVEHWMKTVGQQIICEAEMYALLLARLHLGKRFSKRRMIFWVDNEACRFSVIKSTSRSAALLVMTQEFHYLREKDQVMVWIERVPSSSNAADWPSRGEFQLAEKAIGGSSVRARNTHLGKQHSSEGQTFV